LFMGRLIVTALSLVEKAQRAYLAYCKTGLPKADLPMCENMGLRLLMQAGA